MVLHQKLFNFLRNRWLRIYLGGNFSDSKSLGHIHTEKKKKMLPMYFNEQITYSKGILPYSAFSQLLVILPAQQPAKQ